jgi:hypothetical protein
MKQQNQLLKRNFKPLANERRVANDDTFATLLSADQVSHFRGF